MSMSVWSGKSGRMKEVRSKKLSLALSPCVSRESFVQLREQFKLLAVATREEREKRRKEKGKGKGKGKGGCLLLLLLLLVLFCPSRSKCSAFLSSACTFASTFAPCFHFALLLRRKRESERRTEDKSYSRGREREKRQCFCPFPG